MNPVETFFHSLTIKNLSYVKKSVQAGENTTYQLTYQLPDHTTESFLISLTESRECVEFSLFMQNRSEILDLIGSKVVYLLKDYLQTHPAYRLRLIYNPRLFKFVYGIILDEQHVRQFQPETL